MRVACYIDPGTGSMLFTIFIGIVSGLLFVWRKFLMKIKFLFNGGRVVASEEKYPFVIFSDSKRYWNVFCSICEEFEKRKIPLEYMTASPDDPALSEQYEYVHCTFIGEKNKAFAQLNLLNAGIVLSTTPGLDVYQWKRSKYVKWYVHIFHAVDEGMGYRMFGMDYYDTILLTGEFQKKYIWELENLRGLPPKELFVTGSTYMDALKEKREENQKKVENGEKYILLAPSWGESSIFTKYGAKIIRELLKTSYHLIIRPHPQSVISEKDVLAPLQKEFPNSDKLYWNYDNDNFEALQKADVLITDFSGIIFDFALVFGKPVIYADTSFDKAPYDAAWIEAPLWRFEVLKEIGIELKQEDFPNMQKIIDDLLKSSARSEAIQKVRDEAWQYQGEGARRTVDFLVKKYRELFPEEAVDYVE